MGLPGNPYEVGHSAAVRDPMAAPGQLCRWARQQLRSPDVWEVRVTVDTADDIVSAIRDKAPEFVIAIFSFLGGILAVVIQSWLKKRFLTSG